MVTRIKSNKILTPSGVVEGYIYFDEKGIISVGNEELSFDKELGYEDSYVSAGFIDLHVHGGVGNDFAECDTVGVAEAVDYHLSHGTTTICPTITSSSYETMVRSLSNVRECKEKGMAKANIFGAHLEGPYFSPAQAGAQPPQFITDPIPDDYESLIADFGDVIKRWSYAPERDKSQVFCKYLKEHNILPSAGHTDALYEDVSAAHNAGCNSIAHLYSCTSTITRDHGYRRLGVTEAAYLLDDMYAEIIADGHHLPLELIRLICKLKDNSKICLVTDCLKVSGSGEVTGNVGATQFIVEDGVCKLPDRSAFAGSIATTDRLVRTVVSAGIPLEKAVKMVTENPAALLKVNKGKLEKGYDSDIVVFDENINIEKVIVGGKEMN